jgi:hypothetical protein
MADFTIVSFVALVDDFFSDITDWIGEHCWDILTLILLYIYILNNFTFRKK